MRALMSELDESRWQADEFRNRPHALLLLLFLLPIQKSRDETVIIWLVFLGSIQWLHHQGRVLKLAQTIISLGL